MAESQERVYILSEDYWGFDSASKNDTLNFYDNVWTLKKNQYDGLPEDVRNQLYRCALFYHKARVDNHGYTPLAIRDEGQTVKVRGPNRQGLVEMRTYSVGQQSPPYVVTDGTDTITMREANSSANDVAGLEATSGGTTPGTFTINEFLFEEKDILDKINSLEGEIGDVINVKSAEGDATAAVAENVPADVALQVSEPQEFSPNVPYSNSAVIQDSDAYIVPSGLNEGQFGADEEEEGGDNLGYVDDTKTDRMGPKRATLRHRLSAKARRKGRKAQHSAKYDAEDAIGQIMTTQAYGQAGADYDHEIHYRSEDVPPQAELGELPAVPAIPNTYGEDSAWTSGYGVPQWYGSAESPMAEQPTPDSYDESHPLESNPTTADFTGSIDDASTLFEAESKFDKLAHKISMQYQDKGVSRKEADMIGRKTAAVIGRRKYGPAKFAQMGRKGRRVARKGRKNAEWAELGELPPIPVVANTYGEGSADGSGYGVPQWYGSSEWQGLQEGVNSIYYEQVGGDDALGVGLPVVPNSWGEDSAVGGRGAPEWYGSAEPESVAVDESQPTEYAPYEFVDAMTPDGEYITADDFMQLLSETIDGMAIRYDKPGLFGNPVALGVGGVLLTGLGYMLWSRK